MLLGPALAQSTIDEIAKYGGPEWRHHDQTFSLRSTAGQCSVGPFC